MQPEIITRRFRPALAALLAITVAAATRPAAQEADARFADAPAYLALFAPRADRTAYRTATSPLELDAVLASLAGDDALVRTPGAWQPRAEAPQDAFGIGGDYNAWTVARLYGGGQPRVARGPKLEGGRIAEAWILVSPYPDVTLTRLLPGTLRIAVAIPPN